MKLTYQLNQNDFLQHQLFVASKSPRIRKNRLKSRLFLSGTMLLLSFLFYARDNHILFYYFLIAAAITFIFYPYYLKWQYKKHYQKFIADTYKNRFGQTANIELTELSIETHDITGESKIYLTEIESVTETSSYFYIHLRTGSNLIIPKSQVDNILLLKDQLHQLCKQLNIPFIEDFKWIWK